MELGSLFIYIEVSTVNYVFFYSRKVPRKFHIYDRICASNYVTAFKLRTVIWN